MLTCDFELRPRNPIRTERSFQWDYNQVLAVRGVTILSPEFHFYSKELEKALVVKGTIDENSKTATATIPNILFQKPNVIQVYLYDEVDGVSGETLSVFEIPVIARPQPEDYEFEETINPGLSEELNKYTQQVKELETALTRLEANQNAQSLSIKQLTEEVNRVKTPKLVLDGDDREYNLGLENDDPYIVINDVSYYAAK